MLQVRKKSRDTPKERSDQQQEGHRDQRLVKIRAGLADVPHHIHVGFEVFHGEHKGYQETEGANDTKLSEADALRMQQNGAQVIDRKAKLQLIIDFG